MNSLHNNLYAKIIEHLPEAIKLRHAIHSYPELAFQENQTSELISQTLKSWGYNPINSIAKTGVYAILDSGKPGKTVALRADMDALPINEQTALSFSSQIPNRMHACGHDGHIATLLLVAKILQYFKKDFKGKIKFIFQPAEENGLGAKKMISEDILFNPKVDAIFGYHNMPGFQKDKIIVRNGCILAGSTAFQIKIKGIGGHSSAPDKAIDPIYIGSIIVQTLQSIISKNTSPLEANILSITQFHSGSADNVIPEIAGLRGAIRYTSNDTFKKIKDNMSELVEGITSSLGAEGSIYFEPTVPATINTLNETNLVKEIAKQIYSDAAIIELETNLMPFEDFSFYLTKVPGCYFMIGMGNNKEYCHHPKYEFDDSIIPVACEMLATTAINYLNRF